MKTMVYMHERQWPSLWCSHTEGKELSQPLSIYLALTLYDDVTTSIKRPIKAWGRGYSDHGNEPTQLHMCSRRCGGVGTYRQT